MISIANFLANHDEDFLQNFKVKLMDQFELDPSSATHIAVEFLELLHLSDANMKLLERYI